MLICLDIDGTCADIGPRLAAAGQEPLRQDRKAFQHWLDKLQSAKSLAKDAPIYEMQLLAQDIAPNNEIIYVTGREEAYREVTHRWLNDHCFPSGRLFMRPAGNEESPEVYKEKVIKAYLTRSKANKHKGSSFGGVVVFDDDPRMIEMCKRNHWLLLGVHFESN